MFSSTFLFFATLMPSTSACNMMNLMVAIENRDIDKVKNLLHAVDIESKDTFGRNVLHAAAYSNGKITRLLISHGAGRVVNYHDLDGKVSPLLHACFVMNRHEYLPHMYEIIEAMLKAGGDPNVSDSALCTPLHYVTRGPEARLLISYGANVNAENQDGYTPLSTFFIRPFHQKDHDLVYALAAGNADFTITNDIGETIFHLKSNYNHISWTKEFVMFLAGNGVPLDALNNNGETALTKCLKRDITLNTFGTAHESILYDNLEDSFYAHMAEAGANLNASNEHGENLLLLAVLNYLAGMAKWLLENGADVEAKNEYGDPPLLAFIKQEKLNYEGSAYSLQGRIEADKMKAVIDVLVKGGADVEFFYEDGRNAADYLREWGITCLTHSTAPGDECPDTRVVYPKGSVESYMHRVSAMPVFFKNLRMF